MKQMAIGQKWKTRDGSAAEITGHNASTNYEWFGTVAGQTGCWTQNGSAYNYSASDLIELYEDVTPKSALDIQISGSHYKDMVIQPVEFIHRNKLSFIVGNVIKYVCRADKKGGATDLEKARHYIDLLIELEKAK